MIRTCKHCRSTSETAEFYKGVNSRCKECHKREVRQNRIEKADQYRAYEKMRYKRDGYRREYNSAWLKTEKGRASHAQSVRRRNLMHPDRRAANVILGNAVRDGKIRKPLYCSRCFDCPPRRQLHAHHEDYSKPLDVEWICAKCHGLEHYGEAPEVPEFSKQRGRYVARTKEQK